MIEPWVPITVAAALLQCLRTALQRRLKGSLSTNGANFVRYLYGAPLAVAMLLVLLNATDASLPPLTPGFLAYCLIGGIAQIVATSLLILAFTLRNFAVGTTYSKTETIQTALLSSLVLGESLNGIAWAAIVVCLFGVLVLSLSGTRVTLRDVLFGWTEKAALYGLMSGGMFAVSAVAIRGAALSLGDADVLVRAVVTLAVITTLQTAIMTAYLAWRERPELRKVVIFWRPAALVGLMSVVGSAAWFTAMTLQNVAYVRALGQVELALTILVSRFGFGERPTPRELTGIALIAAGVVVLLISR